MYLLPIPPGYSINHPVRRRPCPISHFCDSTAALRPSCSADRQCDNDMPGRYWYAVAVLLVVSGGVASGLLMWSRLANLDAGLTRFVVPGSALIELPEAGAYTIFHESRSVIEGRIYVTENVAGLRVGVRSDETGEPVSLTRPSGSSSYSFGGYTGESVLSFELAKPGRYRLSASYPDGRGEPQTVLAVSHGFISRLLTTIFGVIAIGFASFGAAVAIGVVTFLKRRRAMHDAAGDGGRVRLG